jgi:hypothetical protein
MSIKSYTILVVLFVLLLSSAAYADYCNVDILVLDKYGEPIEDATVTLTNGTSGWDSSEITDDDGFIEGKFDLDCGNDDFDYDYDLEVIHDDYQDFILDDFIEDLDGDVHIAVVMRPSLVDFELTIVDDSDDEIDNANVEIVCEEEDRGDEDDFRDYDSAYEGFDFLFMDQDSDSDDEYVGFDYEDDGESDDGDITFEDIESDTTCEINVSKSDYESVTVSLTADLGKDLKGRDGEIELIKPGDASFNAVVRSTEGNAAIQGATVIVVDRDSLVEATGTTNENGVAAFTLETPGCYDILVSKEKHSEATQTNLCLRTGSSETITFFLTPQNNPPEADAGDDVFVTEETEVTLDASGSSDDDGDELTYTWESESGVDIPSIVSPTLILPVGEHVITLTVSDGAESATDSVTVVVESLANCGDGTCSAAEDALDNCPQDCPTCLDSVCGAGESDPDSSIYCPVDCGISAIVLTTNTTDFVPGNTTVLVSVDSRSGERLGGVLLSIESPNGSVSILRTDEFGQATYTFTEEGEYKVSSSRDMYSPSERVLMVFSGGIDLTPVIIIVVIIAAAVVVLLLIRSMNMRKKGGSGWSKQGKFRRKKPSLKA